MPRPWRVAALLIIVARADAQGQTAADPGHKSPVLAGVASYFLPGVGSWYAGDDHHARVHGGIAAGLGGAGIILGLTGDCFELACKEEAASVAISVIMVAYVTNEIWSTVTAVRDANAHNDNAARRTGRIEVAPTFRLAPGPTDAARWRAEIRVLRVELW